MWALKDVTASGVARAIEEVDHLGHQAFLSKYGFRPARQYYVVHEDREYDSKTIAGAAHGYDRPDLGPLTAGSFSCVEVR